MQSKKVFFVVLLFILMPIMSIKAEEVIVEEQVGIEQISADAVADYQVQGSLFQQITDLEQEKVLMQLEKERAQLDLELDRLAAEKIKLHMEIDTLSGRAEQQQQEIETQKAKLEAEAARIEHEKEAWQAQAEKEKTAAVAKTTKKQENTSMDIAEKYRLVNVVGAGNQLQATVEDLKSGQSKRVAVGKVLDGFTVKSISLDEGVVFEGPDGEMQNLNVSNGK
ncbi:MAG: type IV pilus biogenesis protein PilP [Alphaproteobacteria bacterium]|nr:type IV pilus biogenesis protein PilP [Alphaproteobacteria bacterium]